MENDEVLVHVRGRGGGAGPGLSWLILLFTLCIIALVGLMVLLGVVVWRSLAASSIQLQASRVSCSPVLVQELDGFFSV